MHWCLFVILCLPYICFSTARPWNVDDLERGVDVISQTSSPLTKTIDSMTSSLSKALKTASPNLTPILSVSALAYVGYVASVMLFPATLRDVGLPVLQDFKFQPRSIKTPESGFIDSMATGFMKDMLGRTEAADVLRNTSMNAIRNGAGTLRKTTRFLNTGIDSFRGIVDRVATALTPDCLARTMCQIGQFTSIHMPALGPVLRTINTIDLDDYSQALIDGTTIGDCSAVFFQCPLEV